MKIWENEIPFFTEGTETPNEITPYLLEPGEPRPCVIVIPGGGYHFRAPLEGAPIAEFFNSRGMHAVVLEYRVAPNRFPSGLADAQRAVRLVRAHAGEWCVDPERVVVCGFSAGGHLAASTLVWEDVLPVDFPRDEIDAFSCVPNGGILCYPVISVEREFGHVGSGKNLLGDQRYETDAALFSLRNRVTPQTPKAFLWHTSDDGVVNVKNSLTFCEKLRDCGVQFELHVFPHGHHGLDLAKGYPDASKWPDLAADWIERNI